MAAYAAVISLKNTINRFLEYSCISFVILPSPEFLQLAVNELELLQEILERLDGTSPSKSRTKVNALDDKIKDAVWKLEDLLESHLSGQILSQIQTPRHHLELTCIRRNIQRRRTRRRGRRLWECFNALCSTSSNEEEYKSCGCKKYALKFSIDLQGMRQDVDTFVHTLKKMEKDYIHELDNLPDDDQEEEEESVGSKIDFGGTKSKMVGLSDQFEIVKRLLKRKHVSLIGMAGIGKTALAKQVFEDPLILTHFECRAWVRVGRKSKFNGVSLARAILAELDPTNCKFTEGDERIGEYLEEILGDKKCLIVLDDVWIRNAPDDDCNPFSCFDHITTLKNLKTLKCSILNPVAKHGFVPPMTHFPTFPSGLQNLHLSGLGYPWECMKVIGSLPSLKVLKLRCYAFRGPNWVVESESFLSLEFLLIEDTDLVQWRPGPGSFRNLCYLSMKHCYKLEELHWPSDHYAKRIELVDCNPLAVDCAEQLKRQLNIRLDVVSSFKGGKKSNDD